MAKRWYVVQVYSNYEDKVEQMLRENAERAGLADKFGQILVPREDVVELKEGQSAQVLSRLYPG